MMKFLQILILIFGLTVFVGAQKNVLSGTVYDASGAVIPNAKVTAISEKREKFETVTNDQGIYSLNLSFNRTSIVNFKIAKYEIIVDLRDRGFDEFVVKEFKFVPAYTGKMFFDIALDSINPEPYGYSGGDRFQNKLVVEPQNINITNKISQRPLEKLPKAKIVKRKNKNK